MKLHIAADAANRRLRVANCVAMRLGDRSVTTKELILACIHEEPLGPDDLSAIGAAFGICGNEMKYAAHHLIFEGIAQFDTEKRVCVRFSGWEAGTQKPPDDRVVRGLYSCL